MTKLCRLVIISLESSATVVVIQDLKSKYEFFSLEQSFYGMFYILVNERVIICEIKEKYYHFEKHAIAPQIRQRKRNILSSSSSWWNDFAVCLTYN